MIPLDRTAVVVPASWDILVKARMPESFWPEAAAFEARPLASRRKKGFRVSAPAGALPLVETNGTAKPDFPALWTEDEVLHGLIAGLSHGNCAYCQSDAEASHSGHVDHVDPKSLFPSKAYDPDNYLFGCERCNVAKGRRWPEPAGHLRPDRGDPSGRLVFDEAGGVVGAAGDQVAGQTVTDLKLDRVGLKTRRKTLISYVLNLVRKALQSDLSLAEKRARVAEHLLPAEMTFSAAVNQCVRRVWEAETGVPW